MNVVTVVKRALRWPTESNLRLFFFITLGWTWIIGMIPVMLGINSTDHGNLIFVFSAGIAPSCVGLIMVFTTYSREARKDFFRRFIPTWRGGWFVLLYAIILLGASTIGVALLVGEQPDFGTINAFGVNPLYVMVFIFFMYLWGPANEEFGWRGYALDRLLVGHGFVRGNVILGFLWGIWHLPWIFYAAQWQSQAFDLSPLWFVAFVVSTIVTSFVMSIAYILSKRNYFTATSVHAVSNAILGLFYTQMSLPAQNVALLCDVGVSLVLVVVVLVVCKSWFSARLDQQMRTVAST